MTSSSMMNRKVFENVRFSNILVLLDILLASQERRLFHVKKIYSERAERYAETVACVTRIGMVKQTNDSLQLCVDWVSSNKKQRHTVVLENLLKSNNRYGISIFRFIEKFRVMDGDVMYSSSAQDKSSESAVRNFLIEMNIVKHRTGTSKYFLAPEYINLYVRARNKAKQMSPSALVAKLSTQNDIGYEAETVILAHERDRVGAPFADRIEHVSQKNVAAGYDIRSFTLKDNTTEEPRFIEVKAVPSQSYQFYWSRNEVDTAQTLNELYHLYLLPFGKHGNFDISRLKIIANPYNTLLADDTAWICETDALVCSLQSPHLQ